MREDITIVPPNLDRKPAKPPQMPEGSCISRTLQSTSVPSGHVG